VNGLSVIIPSRNPLNLTRCIDRIQRCDLESKPARIIVIDDGLDWSVLPGVRRFAGVEFIDGVKPFVYARNCNRGILYAGGDDVVLLNDDALLGTPCGLTAMQRVIDLDRRFGLAAAVTNNAGNPAQQPWALPGLNAEQRKLIVREEPRTVNFICVLIPRRTLLEVGLLDERFVGYGGDDDDYCLRVRNAGLKIGIFDGCFVDHLSLRSTFRGDPRAPGDYSAMNEIFREKWGHDIWGRQI